MNAHHYLLLIIFYLIGVNGNLYADNKAALDSLLNVLDENIAHSNRYKEEKEAQIHMLKIQVENAKTDEELYQNYNKLFDEYKSYKYDSAYVYANKALQLAQRMEDKDYITVSQTQIVFCLMSSGLFKEAADRMQEIDPSQTATRTRIIYYSTYSRLYYDLADYVGNSPFQRRYEEQGNLYTDSLLQILPEMSSEYLYAIAQRQMKERQYEDAKSTFNLILRHTDIDQHTHAIAASCLGWMHLINQDREKALFYLAQAAIDDIQSNTKETTALNALANLLYQQNDIDRAVLYVHRALEDANFYNARHRKIEVGALLPIIEKEHFNLIKEQRNRLFVYIFLIALPLLLLIVATLFIYKQVKSLRNAQSIIKERNQELQQANRLLTEANHIKDEYIGYSFYINSDYIEKLENIYKTVSRKVSTRQYEDLLNTFKSSNLAKERERMYASFDETFLRLFPTFVTQYNELFAEEDRSIPLDEKSLTPEMRIFALIRLGVNKPERIARFLNYSVNTINTYKTRVKNKSLISNEEFENRIMLIGTM